MWGATFPSQASIDGMLEADQRSYDGWAELIRHGQDDGSIRADLDPAAAAVVLFGLMRGVAALLLTDSEINDMRNVRATCDAWIVAALAPPAAASARRSRGTPWPSGSKSLTPAWLSRALDTEVRSVAAARDRRRTDGRRATASSSTPIR